MNNYAEQQQLKNSTGVVIDPATSQLQDTIIDLAESIQELSQRLAFLGSIKQHQTESLRATIVNTTTVTGPLTDAQNTAANLATLRLTNTYVGDIAVQSNINNVVVTS